MSAKKLLPTLLLTAAVCACAGEEGGFRPLFDGKSFDGWTGMRGRPLPTQSWAVEEGMIRTREDGSGGDLRTQEEYSDFDLRFEWKISEKGNAGVKYNVQEEWTNAGFRPDHSPAKRERSARSAVGYEYQISDDTRWDRSHDDWAKSATGAYYLVKWVDEKPLKQVGEWNSSRIVVRGNQVEHWLNGEKLFEFELGSKDILERVAKTKFRQMPGYGLKGPGPIVLQHHGSPAWFRNIRIKTE